MTHPTMDRDELTSRELPEGMVLHLHPQVRVRDGGGTLIGGAPMRAVHLGEQARALVQSRRIPICDRTSRRLATHLLSAGMAQPDLVSLPETSPSDITCVVPVKDRPEGLDRLLTALAGTFSTLVVDDASTDAASIAAVAKRHGAQLIRLSRNLGPGGARNAGIAAVGTPYVLLVDSDVTIDPSQVLRMACHLHDPGLGVVAPRILGDERHSTRLAAYEAARSSLDLGTSGGLVHPRTRIGWLPAACLLARVSALGKGFDPTMRVGEDVDLVWRLVRAGWRVRYEPSVVARHEHRRSLRPWLARKAFYGTGGAPLAARHGSDVAPAALSPLGAAIGVAALAQRRWSAPVAAGLFSVMTVRLARSLHRSPRPARLAIELSGLGLSAVFEQGAALLLRHWWPATAVGLVISSRVRRAVLVAAIADSVIEYLRTAPDLDLPSFFVLRRLDDLAYGAGLWAGAVRARSARALVPRIRLRA